MGKAWSFLLLGAILAGAAPVAATEPAADLCVITLQLEPGFGRATLRIDLIYNETRWEGFAEAVDVDGDDLTTTAEVAAFPRSTHETMTPPVERPLLRDGWAPSTIHRHYEVFNFEGPTHEPRPRLVTEVWTYTFPPLSERPQWVVFQNDEAAPVGQQPGAVIEVFVVEAPEGYVVDWVQAADGPWQETVWGQLGNPTVRMEGFATQTPYSVTLRLLDPQDQDGAAPVVAIVGGVAFLAILGGLFFIRR